MTHPPVYLDPKDASPRPSLRATPDEFSWKDYEGKDWTSPARDQGYCGSCWDFAALGAFESIINIREGYADLDPDLSEQYVLSCLPAAGSCNGGSAYQALRLIMETTGQGNYHNGVIPESCFPYQADDEIPCDDKCTDWEEQLVPIQDIGYWYTDGNPADIEAIKLELMDSGPIVSYLAATSDFIMWGLTNHDSSDYFAYPGEFTDINHCVVIVGWKDDPEIGNGGYWIVKNSWGQNWGYEGFFNIEYGSLRIDDYRIIWVDYDPSSFNWPPVADTGGPYNGNIEVEITFDASDSYDPEGIITSYHWDFGDSTNDTGSIVSHTYSEKGIYDVILTVTDENAQTATEETVALIDFWNVNNNWAFSLDGMDLQLELDDQSLSFTGSLDELTFTVGSDADDYYQLDIDGKMTADLEFNFNTGSRILGGSGRLTRFNKIQGAVRFRQSDLSVDHFEVEIIGIAIAQIDPIPIPLPIPIRVTLKTDFNPPYNIFPFPLKNGNTGYLPSTDISIEATIGGIFGLIKIPFDYTLKLPSLPYSCTEEEITVEEGTYNAYKISIFGFNYYFAPEAGQIIKINGEYGEIVSINGELISKQY